MSRYFLSANARNDLDAIRVYLDHLPAKPARQIAQSLQKMLKMIADIPELGIVQSDLSRIVGAEVRSRFVSGYRIFYLVIGDIPQVIAVLHTARDVHSIMINRVQ